MNMKLGINFFWLVVAALFLSGCNKFVATNGGITTSAYVSVLDELVTNTTNAFHIQQAEQNLSTDTWKTGGLTRPGRVNISRNNRERGLANELLEPIKSKVKGMGVRELLNSLKTIPYKSLPTNYFGVSGYIYTDGNRVILNEIYHRRQSELEILRPYQHDQRIVYTGEDGPPVNVADVVQAAFQKQQ